MTRHQQPCWCWFNSALGEKWNLFWKPRACWKLDGDSLDAMNDNSYEATSLGEIIIMLMMIMATMMRRWDDEDGDNDDDDGHNDDDKTGIRALERWLEIWSCRRTLSQTVTNETTPQTCPQFLFWTRIILMTIGWWWWYKQWYINNEQLGKAWKSSF